MSSKFAYVDFEFNGVSEKRLNVVCCTVFYDGNVKEFWLLRSWDNYDFSDFVEFIDYLETNKYTLVAFAAEAEASSLISLGFDPLMFKWVDLHAEYRMLQNHNYRLLHGKQLIEGNIKETKIFGEKGKQNLAAVYYKLCGKLIDTDHKEAMRQIIIHGTPAEIEANKGAIQKYCTSDVMVLPEILEAVKKEYLRLIPRKNPYSSVTQDNHALIKQEANWRAETSVRTAMMVRHGYPINVEWARNLTDNIPHILNDIIQDINQQFPDMKPFKWNKQKKYKTGEVKEEAKYSMDQNVVKLWIKKNHPRWATTPTGDYSLKLEEFEKEYSFRHDFPRFNFGAQIVRYLKTAQSLKGFKDKGGSQDKCFWDHVGSDGMVRSYINPYGAQSSRYQPGSIGFLFLKSAWQRSICQAPKGYAIGAIDFASEEVLIGAILSGDKKLFQAYCTGDIYLAYGKEIGVIPSYGTKKTHEKERDAQKPVILGWSYLSTGYGLSKQLRNQTGKEWTPEDAQELLDKLDATYSTFSDYRNRMIDTYSSYKHIKLPDGWYMWGDNQSHRSVANCHPQGWGACILRKAIQLAQDAGLQVLYGLHDAVYIMFKEDHLEIAMAKLRECMYEAFLFYFQGESKEWAKVIRMDSKAWADSYVEEEVTLPTMSVKKTKHHVDSRAKEEYAKFHKYLTTNVSQELL